LIEKDKQDSRLKTSEDEYNLGAFVIDDINDLVFCMISCMAAHAMLVTVRR
jgi:hypothetical protein